MSDWSGARGEIILEEHNPDLVHIQIYSYSRDETLIMVTIPFLYRLKDTANDALDHMYAVYIQLVRISEPQARSA